MAEEIKNGPEAVSLDFTFAGDSSLYGLPERIDRFQIEDTVTAVDQEGAPYRLFTADHFNDQIARTSIYGVIPMVIGRAPSQGKVTSAVMWANSADTFVDVYAPGNAKGRTCHFMSECNQLEFFLFSGKDP